MKDSSTNEKISDWFEPIIFLISTYVNANEALIGSWKNDEGLRIDIEAKEDSVKAIRYR
jgi:hypothetical protein